MSALDSPSFTLLGKVAVVVALALAVVQLVVAYTGTLLRNGPLRIETGVDQFIGAFGDAALVMALLVLVFVGITAATLKWVVAGLYTANLVGSVLFRLNYDFALSADLLLNPLYSVTLFLAIVAAVRTVRGETVLPGVALAIDADTLRVDRTDGPGHEEPATKRKAEPR